MKRLFVILVLLFVYLGAMAQGQYNIDVKITNLDKNPDLAKKIENTLSKFFTELNRAYFNSDTLRLDANTIDEYARETINDYWKASDFYLPCNGIISLPIAKYEGLDKYRVLESKFIFSKCYEGSEVPKEFYIDFDTEGKMVGFSINTIPLSIKGDTLVSGAMYDQIMSYMAKLCNAHANKKISVLEDLYSDYALIITGKSVTARKSTNWPENNIHLDIPGFELNVKTKTQYLNDLREVFRKNGWIRITYKDPVITVHNNRSNLPTYKDIYFVECEQIYESSSGYKDNGYLTIVWDFSDAEHPEIICRVWLDQKINPFMR